MHDKHVSYHSSALSWRPGQFQGCYIQLLHEAGVQAALVGLENP